MQKINILFVIDGVEFGGGEKVFSQIINGLPPNKYEIFLTSSPNTHFYSSIQLLLLIINVILHIIFASAVAKDAGNLVKGNRETTLVSGITWSFATLLGGVYIAIVYWVIHHAKFARG